MSLTIFEVSINIYNKTVDREKKASPLHRRRCHFDQPQMVDRVMDYKEGKVILISRYKKMEKTNLYHDGIGDGE